jgi:chitinase
MRTLAAALLALLAAPMAWAEVLLQQVAGGLVRPLGIVGAGDGSGRLFIVEQGGLVRVLKNGQVRDNPLLDISHLVSCCDERGLLGFAFDPRLNGHVYVNYTDHEGATVVSRYTIPPATPNRVDPESARVVIRIPQPYPNHNGGQLAFGPDRMLYIGVGDGGGTNDPDNRAQDLGSLLGKILRIDVTTLPYAIPPDNPFINRPGARGEIHALGLRNPWRFSFDRQTGDLWIGDVGEHTWEEVDFEPRGTRGANYGWRRMEGPTCHIQGPGPLPCPASDLVTPLISLHHFYAYACSITGGYRYRGSQNPDLLGAYLFGDFCTGTIRSARSTGWNPVIELETAFPLSSFGEDDAGEIYVADYGAGVVHRILGAAGAATLSVADMSEPEGTGETRELGFSVTLSRPRTEITRVDYRIQAGSAGDPRDFQRAGAGRLEFAPGETEKLVRFWVVADDDGELDETLSIELTKANGARIADGQATATLLNDDPLPALSAAPCTLVEDNFGSRACQFWVRSSFANGEPVSARWAIEPVTATEGVDYREPFAGTLTISGGGSAAAVAVWVWADTRDEPDETYRFRIFEPTAATIAEGEAVGTIVDDDAPPSVSISNAQAVEGAGQPLVFTATLSLASGFPVSVQATTSDDTATSGADYAATSGSIEFPPGTLTRTFSVAPLDDADPESHETFFVTLSAPENAVLADAQGTGSVRNDDGGSAFSVEDLAVTEGDAGASGVALRVRLDPPAPQQVSVQWRVEDSDAKPGADFVADGGSLEFAPGEAEKTVALSILGDVLDEYDEQVRLKLRASRGATIDKDVGLVTILDDDPLPVVLVPETLTTADESQPLALELRLSAPSGRPVTVYRIATTDSTTTALGGIDFGYLYGDVTFPPGSVSLTTPLPILDDDLDESPENFVVMVHAPFVAAANATFSREQVRVFITDDDPTPTLSLVGEPSLLEGHQGTRYMNFPLTLSNPSSRTIRFRLSTADGTGVAGVDYMPISSTISWSPGFRTPVGYALGVGIIANTLDQPDRTLRLVLSEPENATLGRSEATGTILDDDEPSYYSIDDVAVREGKPGALTVYTTVRRAGTTTVPGGVRFSTLDGSARAPSDYAAASGRVDFPPGTDAQTLDLAIVSDKVPEPDESFSVQLSDPVAGTIADGSAEVRIVAALPGISVSDAVAMEGDSGTSSLVFEVSLSHFSGRAASVAWVTRPGSARRYSDYVKKTGTLSFPPGIVRLLVEVPIVGDTSPEPTESLSLELSQPAGATLVDPLGIGTILDDDP